jgi:cold shock CspA family protein
MTLFSSYGGDFYLKPYLAVNQPLLLTMAKSQDTWNKKEMEKKGLKKRQDKEQKKEERKANAKEGTSFNDMIAYVDEYGNLSSTPPTGIRRESSVRAEDIQIGVPKRIDVVQDTLRKGIVTFFNDSKGYGFIKDSETQESIFVHANGLLDPIKDNNKVTFEVEMGHKGPNAVKVKLAVG